MEIVLILISGPTAVGKTKVGIKVCQKLGKAEIISVDSRQIYRYMDIGTAKPSLEECQGIPHHFIDCLFPTQSINAGEFARRARIIINQMSVRGVTPVLVGGSGLYWQAIIDGFFEDNSDYSIHRAKLQKRLKENGIECMYRELQRLDPVGSEKIREGDRQRILRALEVYYANGMTLSQHWLKKQETHVESSVGVLMVAIHRPRAILYERINWRVENMLRNGLISEVSNLLSMYRDIEIPVFDTIGYREIRSYLNGEGDLVSAINDVKQNSRRFAKRQLTFITKDRRFRSCDIDKYGADDCADKIAEHYCRIKSHKSFDTK